MSKLKELHYTNELLVLPNAWDAKSAMMLQEAGYKAVGTSSAAVARGIGYDDGEQMPFEDYLFVIRRMVSSISIPLTVDMEMGYGATADKIFSNFRTLAGLGVAGVNLEDSVINKGQRALDNAEQFAKKLETISNKIKSAGIELFLNVRCDTYILNVPDKQIETRKRIKLYENSGADGIFLPAITTPDDIKDAVKNTSLPVSVMCYPGLPDFNTLQSLGVKRASMGPFLFNNAYTHAGNLAKSVLNDNNFSSLLK